MCRHNFKGHQPLLFTPQCNMGQLNRKRLMHKGAHTPLLFWPEGKLSGLKSANLGPAHSSRLISTTGVSSVTYFSCCSRVHFRDLSLRNTQIIFEF